MKPIRRIGLWTAGALFAVCVGIIIAYTILSATLLSQTAVKGWLQKSSTYSQLADGVIIPMIEQSYAQQGQVQGLLTADMITTASSKSITPSFVQSASEKAIDGFYGWLNGKTSSPQFTIPLSGVQAGFYSSLHDQLLAKLESLPICGKSQQYMPDSLGVVSCMPTTYTPQSIANQVTAELKANSNLFTTPIKPTDIAPSTVSTPSSVVNTTPLPQYILFAGIVYWIAMVLALCLAMALLFLARFYWRGLVMIGWRVLVPGLFSLITGWVAVQAGPHISLGSLVVAQANQAGILALADSLLHTVVVSIGGEVLKVGGFAAAIGLIFLLSGFGWRYVLKRKQEPSLALAKI